MNLWDLRRTVTPMKMLTVDAIRATKAAGLAPDLIYVDADHDYAGVRRDVELCSRLFPDAVLVGDDWDYAGVREAAQELRGSRPLHVGGFKCWAYAELPRSARAVVVPPHDNPIAMGGVTFWPDARKQERRDVLIFRCVFDQLQAWDNAEALEYLLEATACAPDASSPSHKHRTLLMVAALFGRVRGIRALAVRGADVNRQAPGSGEHALQLAAYGGRLDAVAELLRLGADATLRTKYDETAEDAARANGQDACAELLRTGAAPARRDAATRAVQADAAKGEKAPWFDAAATAVYARTPPAATPAPAPWRRGGGSRPRARGGYRR